MRKQIANILTISRIVVAMILCYCPIFGLPFWILYAWCGISDVLDGYVARKTGSASERGATLDSIADFIFVGVWLYKIIPAISLPAWIWVMVIVIALVKCTILMINSIRNHQMTMPHSISNKVTGVLLFLFPITIQFVPAIIPALVVCAAAIWSTINDVTTRQ